jgi:hypothetical protein
MLEDIAVMVFAFGLPVALSIMFRNDEQAIPKWVKSLACLSILIGALFLFDCVKQGDEARKQLATAQQQLKQFRPSP